MPNFKVTRYKIRAGSTVRGPEDPFSVVFLSDLHNVSYGENNSALLQAIRNENPALVLIGGDMLTESGTEPQLDAAVALMDELTKKYPVYYANGNHECRLKYGDEREKEQYDRYAQKIRSLGVQMLENRGKLVEISRMPIKLWGLEIPMECYRRGIRYSLKKEEIEERIGAPDPEAFNLLMAHHPMHFDVYASWGADLTLSGHLHGGLVRLPFLGGVVSPQFRLFPKYDRGLFSLGEKKLIVSGGLGSHTIPIRINNPPELIVIDFI